MRIVCNKTELLRAVTVAQNAVSNKSTLPVLSNLLIEAREGNIIISGTDLEIGLRIKTAGEVIEPGSVTVPAKKMVEIVREFPDAEIEFNVKDGTKIEIRCGKSHFKISGIHAEDFPNLPEQKKDKSVSIEDKILLRMIKKTFFSVSNEETRRVLNGALFLVEKTKAKMVSTDGHRLSYIERELGKPMDSVAAVVPTKALNEMMKILDGSDELVTVYFTENHLFVEKNSTMLVSRLIDGQFPNYEQVIPKKGEISFKADREELVQATRRVSLMASDRANSIKFTLKDGSLSIHSNTPDIGEAEEDMDVEYTGAEMSIAFNAKYVLDAIRAVETAKVEFRLSTPLSPGLVLPVEENADSKFVVMPMRT
ncbi:MAG: DNA polymerase III subunit beta [candidate division FCPU426 bacterium]